MKTCSKCQEKKPLNKFARKRDGYSSYCKACKRAYNKKHYARNREKHRKNVNKSRKRNRKIVRPWIWSDLESKGCCDCGEKDPIVLDYDHRDDEDKKYNISDMRDGSYSLETIKKEVAKCDVRCANCHRRRTAKQQGWYASLA